MSLRSDSGGSIRRRLLISLLPALFILMLAGVFANYRAAMLFVSTAYDRRLGEEARALAASVRAVHGSLGVDSQSAGDGALGVTRPGAIEFSIRGPHGQLLAGNPRLGAAPAGAANPSYANVELRQQAFRVATYRLQTALGVATINVAEVSAGRAASGHFILASTWLMDFIQVDVTLLFVWIAVHFGLKPLLDVRRQIEARSARELQPLKASAVSVEIRPLVDALNLLFDMLRESSRSQRQFVADTAHQLRTPIAGLLGQLELLMREPAAASMRDRLSMLHEGMTRLAHSANQLLTLARADPSARVVDRFESVDLRALAGRVVELNVRRAVESGHDLGADARPAEVSGIPRLLEDLLGNLVDNALSYTPEGSCVTVRCGVTDASPFLEVEDDGPGIAEPERAHVRERFYRIPGTPGHGCGLGLAIVEEIARLHDATVTLDAGTGGRGTRVRIRFPAAIAPPGRALETAVSREIANNVAV
jgi:two-component system, OmpR family, sensor histidine kinase TctE